MTWQTWKKPPWFKDLESEEARNVHRRHYEGRILWAEQNFPDLPSLEVLRVLPRLRAVHGKTRVTHDLIRKAVERSLALDELTHLSEELPGGYR